MGARRWARIRALFHDALEHPPAERRSLLEERCGDDRSLVDEVMALLEQDARGQSLLDAGLAPVAHEVLDGGVAVPRTIGPYRIRRLLGRGGMGIVYLAERTDLGNWVAVKVLRDGWLSPTRRELFEAEQQTLAQLNHPGIARLYDAHTLPDGTPYFVMEYVEGLPLAEYCRTRGCSIAERLSLFRRVCEAVKYAHRHAVVHCDLKPSNVLVTEDRQIKLLDFGIATRLEKLGAHAPGSKPGLRLMTPSYAAPEQLRGEPVGVHTDVYALGVLLYELLTGGRPFEAEDDEPGGVETRILAGAPDPPSRVARRNEGDSPGTGSRFPRRGAWADLDALCLSAIHLEPKERYPTVEALSRDLQRFRSRRPLSVRRGEPGYRMRKFLLRRRKPVTAAAIVAGLAVVLGAVYLDRVTDARDAALAEASRAQRIESFMLSVFEGGAGGAGPADSLRVVTLLERGAQEARLLDAEPAVQAELYHTLGALYQELGELARADSLLQLALDQRHSLLGPEHPDVSRSLVSLGLLRSAEGRFEEAEGLMRDALERARRSLPRGHPGVARALTGLGTVLQHRGNYEEALVLLDEAAELREAGGGGPPGFELTETLTQLANTHFYAGNYQVSDSLNRVVLALDQRLYGERHPSVADALINLGAARHQLGYYEEAEELYRQALEIKEGYYGPDHHETAANMMMLGQALAFQERYEEALVLLEPALSVRERVYGSDHPRVANTLNELGTVALRQGDLATAESSFARMVEIYRAAHDDRHYLIGIALSNLASVYLEADRQEEAEETLRDALQRFEDTLPADHLHTAVARIKLGDLFVRGGRHVEAEEPLLDGYTVLGAQANPSVSWLRRAREHLVAVYEALGQAEEAERFRAEIASAEEAADGR